MNFSILILLVALIAIGIIAYLLFDYLGPRVIQLNQDEVFGMKCQKAKDLLVQEYDDRGNLLASRGFLIYKLDHGSNNFRKIARISVDFSILWFSNFKIFRNYTLKHECIELKINTLGDMCALAGGYMWYMSVKQRKFRKTMKLTHFGFMTGRGIMSTGIMSTKKGDFYFGEYFANPSRSAVNIYKFNNKTYSWSVAYKFPWNHIRHIHALQIDPYTDRLWICTGDENKEAIIGWSGDNFKTITPIGTGSQQWRACQVVFTDKYVYWGTDSSSKEHSGIYSFDKTSNTTVKLENVKWCNIFRYSTCRWNNHYEHGQGGHSKRNKQ
jgi:hypothetical protein